jgi:hypothetical protein
MLNFSYLSAIGNMDEAFKAIKLIKRWVVSTYTCTWQDSLIFLRLRTKFILLKILWPNSVKKSEFQNVQKFSGACIHATNQPRTQALSTTRLAGGKTLVQAGHVSPRFWEITKFLHKGGRLSLFVFADINSIKFRVCVC